MSKNCKCHDRCLKFVVVLLLLQRTAGEDSNFTIVASELTSSFLCLHKERLSKTQASRSQICRRSSLYMKNAWRGPISGEWKTRENREKSRFSLQCLLGDGELTPGSPSLRIFYFFLSKTALGGGRVRAEPYRTAASTMKNLWHRWTSSSGALPRLDWAAPPFSPSVRGRGLPLPEREPPFCAAALGPPPELGLRQQTRKKTCRQGRRWIQATW